MEDVKRTEDGRGSKCFDRRCLPLPNLAPDSPLQRLHEHRVGRVTHLSISYCNVFLELTCLGQLDLYVSIEAKHNKRTDPLE